MNTPHIIENIFLSLKSWNSIIFLRQCAISTPYQLWNLDNVFQVRYKLCAYQSTTPWVPLLWFVSIQSIAFCFWLWLTWQSTGRLESRRVLCFRIWVVLLISLFNAIPVLSPVWGLLQFGRSSSFSWSTFVDCSLCLKEVRCFTVRVVLLIHQYFHKLFPSFHKSEVGSFSFTCLSLLPDQHLQIVKCFHNRDGLFHWADWHFQIVVSSIQKMKHLTIWVVLRIYFWSTLANCDLH